MELEEKIKACRKLARSFRRSDLYEDLVSEGLLAMLETEDRGNNHPETLRMDARLAMQNYISLRQSPLSIPTTRHTRRNANALRKGAEGPVEDMAPKTYKSLKDALEGSTELIEGNQSIYEDSTESYLWVQQVQDSMKNELSERDYQVFLMRYGETDLTLKEVGQLYGITKQMVWSICNRIEKKLRASHKNDL